MFDGFTATDLTVHDAEVGRITLRVRVGGTGPPLLLLHGHPQTSAVWHRVAPRLAREFTVVAPDLRGYGASAAPPTTADHAPYAKRAMARDQVALMGALGHERFAVAGHDRGARVAYRLALDHPGRVTRLAVLDVVPTVEAFDRADAAFGLAYWNWFSWADDVRGRALDCGHYMAEEAPDAVYAELRAFLNPEHAAEQAVQRPPGGEPRAPT